MVYKKKYAITLFLLSSILFTLGTINTSEAHILIIGDSQNDNPTFYQETSLLAANLKQKGYQVLELYRNNATSENILKGMYDADAIIYAGHGGYQSGNYNNAGGPATSPFALVGSDQFIWGIGDKMREGWNSNLFYAPYKPNIPVFLLHACFSTGWVDNYQVTNPTETIYNFARMFTGSGANYYATAWNGAEIIYDFLNGAINFQDANNKNYEKITTSTLYNGTQIWRNNNGYAAFVGNWNGVFPLASQVTPYDESAADAWYHSNRVKIVNGSFYANSNSGNDSWDGSSPIWISGIIGPMKTISCAINALIGKGTIYVAPGTYTENLIIDKDVNILGSSSQNTILTSKYAQNATVIIKNNGSGSVIDGFTITGASLSAGVNLSNANNCTISDNKITGNNVGVVIPGNNNTVIRNNISNNSRGVYIGNNSQNNVTGNLISNSSLDGVYCDGGTDNSINNNVIQNGSIGITLKNSKSLKSEGNEISNNTQDGISLDNATNSTIKNNNIKQNRQNGIKLQNSQKNYITSNHIQNNGGSNSGSGVYLSNSSNNTINSNIISENNDGITLQTNSNQNTINNNTIQARNLLINISGSSGNNLSNNQASFDISQIENAATEVRNYVETYHQLPSITINGNSISMPQLLELLTAALLQINGGNSNLIVLRNITAPVNPKEDIHAGNLPKAEFLKLAGDIRNYMDNTGKTPDYAYMTSLGPYLRFENLVYMYSMILDYYNSSGKIADWAGMEPWSLITSRPVLDPNAPKFTVAQIKVAASTVRNQIEKNHELPSTVTINGTLVDMSQFLELSTTALLQISSGNNNTIPLRNFTLAGSSIDNIRFGNIYKAEYMKIAIDIKNYMDNTGKTPDYAYMTSLGTYLGFKNLVYMYSMILDYYNSSSKIADWAGMQPAKVIFL